MRGPRADLTGGAHGQRARHQTGEVGRGRVPLLAPAAQDPGFLVRHQLEGKMRVRLIPTDYGAHADEPGPPVEVEEFALVHGGVFRLWPAPAPRSIPKFST